MYIFWGGRGGLISIIFSIFGGPTHFWWRGGGVILFYWRRIDRVPNATIYSLTESAPLIERVLGHVLRLPENDPVKGLVMYVPTHGRKKPGRQRTLFTNYIHCPLGDPDNLLNNNQLLEMAQESYQWRKLVVDCSAAKGWWWGITSKTHSRFNN